MITYAGHSTVFVTTEAGTNIVIDPWLAGNPSCPESLQSPEKLDYILLTHGHADHAASAAQLAKDHGAVVVATYELAMLLVSKDGVPEGNIQAMNKGGEIEIGGYCALHLNVTCARLCWLDGTDWVLFI